MLSYAHIIREDPVRRGLLYLGTENALYVSFDDGANWAPLMSGLPPAPFYGLVIQEHFNDLVIGTYGRGFYILDDLSPLQKLTPDVIGSAAYLFPPRAAYRFINIPGNYASNDDPTVGTNPPGDAVFNYWLKGVPQSAPSIAILDAAGKTVRTLAGTRNAGLNRVWWNLNNEPTKTPRLRTKPMFNPEFTMDADGTRPAPGFGTFSVRVPPGRYTVKLTVDGKSFTQPLEVRRDPNSAATLADIKASTDLLFAMQANANTTADMLHTMEAVRSQVATLNAVSTTPADVKSAGDSLDRKFVDVEQTIVDLRLTGRGQDEVRWPVQLGGQLSYLAGGIGSSGFAPTTQQRSVNEILVKQVRATRAALEQLMTKDLSAFNALLRSRGLKTIDVTLPAVVF